MRRRLRSNLRGPQQMAMTNIPTLQRFSHTATISPAQRADGDGGEGSNADRHKIPSAVPIPPTQAGPEETFSGRDLAIRKAAPRIEARSVVRRGCPEGDIVASTKSGRSHVECHPMSCRTTRLGPPKECGARPAALGPLHRRRCGFDRRRFSALRGPAGPSVRRFCWISKASSGQRSPRALNADGRSLA